MPPAATPPSFYDTAMAMGPGPGKGIAPPPNKAGSDEGLDELLKAYSAIFKALDKMAEKSPNLKSKFAPIKDQLKDSMVKVLNVEPKKADEIMAGEPAPPPPTGGTAPGEAGPTPPPPAETATTANA